MCSFDDVKSIQSVTTVGTIGRFFTFKVYYCCSCADYIVSGVDVAFVDVDVKCAKSAYNPLYNEVDAAVFEHFSVKPEFP